MATVRDKSGMGNNNADRPRDRYVLHVDEDGSVRIHIGYLLEGPDSPGVVAGQRALHSLIPRQRIPEA